MLHPSRIARQSGHTSDPNGRRLGRVVISRSPLTITSTASPRTQPASGLRRQPGGSDDLTAQNGVAVVADARGFEMPRM